MIRYALCFVFIAFALANMNESLQPLLVLDHTLLEYAIPGVFLKSEESCLVRTPYDELEYQLSPENIDLNRTSRSRLVYIDSSTSPRCGVKILEVNAGLDTGNWSLIISNSTDILRRHYFSVRVFEITTEVIPKQLVAIVDGQDLYLRFGEKIVSNLVECRVNWTDGRDVVLRPGVVVDPLVEYWGSGLQDECGVMVRNISVSETGSWSLMATNTSGHIVQGNFDVFVRNYVPEVITDQVYIAGKYVTLNLGANETSYCQATRPDGTRDVLKETPCAISLNGVTKTHEGNWSAIYTVPGHIEEYEAFTMVTVIEVETLESSLTESKRTSGALDLLCRWTTYKYARVDANFCRFVRPDGVAFSLVDGVGSSTSPYSYHGDGINFSANVKYCGVTIRRPSELDVGTWQCTIGLDLDQLVGGYIQVPPAAAHEPVTDHYLGRYEVKVKVTGDKEVIVVDGSSMSLGCQATASLTYCWFTHPNGTMLTPVASSSTAGSFTYSGRGLRLGDCSITIKQVSNSDQGTWYCHMGVLSDADKIVPITARVTDTNVVATRSQIQLTSRSSVTLNCSSVPRGVALQYCRFVRPDGVGFGFTKSDDVIMKRYSYQGNGLGTGQCGLKITSVINEDIGTWKCAALHVASTQEGRATIELNETTVSALSPGAIAGIVIGCVIGVAMIGGVTFQFYRKGRGVRKLS